MARGCSLCFVGADSVRRGPLRLGSGFVRLRVFRGSVLAGTAWHINRGRGLYFRCV